MNLNELQLNRFLYKDYDTTNRDTQGQIVTQSNGSSSGSGTGGTGTGTAPATNIAPGTVIISCILQSSGSNQRIEINPDDTFYAYRNGTPVVVINRDGVEADNIAADTNFIYKGIPQPVVFNGEINGITNAWITQPVGWSATKNAVGDYTITHNLNNPKTTIHFTPVTGHFRCKLVTAGPNSFNVTFQQSTYSGGGLYTGEALVDTIFQFSLHSSTV